MCLLLPNRIKTPKQRRNIRLHQVQLQKMVWTGFQTCNFIRYGLMIYIVAFDKFQYLSCHCDQCASPSSWRVSLNLLPFWCWIASAAPLWPRLIRNNGRTEERERERLEDRDRVRYSRIWREDKGCWESATGIFFLLSLYLIFFLPGRGFFVGGYRELESPPTLDFDVISRYCQYAAVDLKRNWQTSHKVVSME